MIDRNGTPLLVHNCSTYDPRLEGEKWVPFRLWPRQGELVMAMKAALDSKSKLLIEKSRDTGVSWCVVGFACWLFVFHRDVTVGLGAALEELVDHMENPKALMWKCRKLLDRLPQWQIPKSYKSSFKSLSNPATGAVFEGQAGNEIGRGGRSTVLFIDEFASVQNSQSVYQAALGNTQCLIMLSTPKGVGNKFQQLRDGGEVEVFSFHWTSDPRKTEEWAAKEKAIDPVAFAQEYDIDYTSSLDNIVIPGDWARAAVNFKVEASGPGLIGMDLGQGTNANAHYALRQGPKVSYVAKEEAKTVEDVFNAVCLKSRIIKGPNGEKVESMTYDASGATGKAASDELAKKRQDGFLIIRPIVGQGPPTRKPLADGRRATETFRNLRAELWWSARERFRKTWEKVNGQADWPDDECASIPDDPVLLRQLSTPLYFLGAGGKIQVESKLDMKARGISSPDRADAVVLAYAAEPPPPRFKSRFAKR